MGFYASWAGQTKLQLIAKPVISSGWTNIAELLFLTSSKYFQSAVARADGMLIPNLHKALFVMRYLKRPNMKFIILFLFFTISVKSFCQRPSKSDSADYETWTYLERIDSSNLTWQTKNELQFAKLKPHIESNSKVGYSFQFVRLCKYLDTAKIRVIENTYDTSLRTKLVESLTYLRKRANLHPGDVFPELILNDRENHKSKVSDLKGKILFIDIWASWCDPCRKQMPKLELIYERFKDRGFVILAISMDEFKEKWLTAIKKDSLNWQQHYCDFVDFDQNRLLTDWGIDAIPYNFLINRDGKLIDKEVSLSRLEKELLKL
jgi:thiol-disulfide isomerase/thioredoxin